jgi:hypothetical protein
MLKLETLADLELLHRNQVSESLALEYKASQAVDNADGRKTEIAKDVSAMANAAGGQFVYGMKERNQLPDGLDGGVDSRFGGLWFEQVIQQNVRPQIEGLVVRAIQRGNGNILVVLNVPPALVRAPHQLKDGRYYRRRNFRNDIMEDYEVREAMRRASTPEPFVDISLPTEPCPITWQDSSSQSNPITLRMAIGNRSREPALYTSVGLTFDGDLVITKHGAMHLNETTDTAGRPRKVAVFNLMVPNHMPLFRERIFRLGDGTSIAIPPEHRSGDYLYWMSVEISTPGYSVRQRGELVKTGDHLTLRWLEA